MGKMIQSGCLDVVDIITILRQLYIPYLSCPFRAGYQTVISQLQTHPSGWGAWLRLQSSFLLCQLLLGKLFQKEELDGDCSCLLHGPCGCYSSQSSSCSSSYFQFAGFPTLWNQPCCDSKRHQPHLGRTPASAPGHFLQVSNNPTFSLRFSTPMGGSCFLHFLSL